MNHLSGIDLNLLVALHALLEERNVTRAATRVGLSQPAMSAALGRLRDLLKDPLLVRTSRGMQPTPRAEGLAGPVRELLAQIDRTLYPPPPFDPAASRLTFILGAADCAELLILPPLMARLGGVAPGINIAFQPQGESPACPELEAGKLDLLIGLSSGSPAGIYGQKLLEEQFACLVRADHPGIGAELTLEQYVALPHMLISPRGGPTGIVDDALAESGLKRRIALRVPHFLVAPQVVARTDLILTLPRRMARAFCTLLPLRMLEPPLKLPGFTLSQLWHERTHRDPAHRWLREMLVDVCREL